MKKRFLSILLVMVLLLAALSVTAMAVDTKPAPNEVSAYASEKLSAALAPVAYNDAGSAYCPVCDKTVTWYATISGADVNLQSYHWFIQKDLERTGTYTVDSGKSVCFYLNGCDITSTKIGFNVAGTLNIIGNGTETVSGTGDGGYGKGSTINVNGGTVNLYGGTYTKQDTVGNAVVALPAANAIVNVYNGTTITGGTSTRNGGNVCLTGNPTKFNLYGGTVSNGSGHGGGNIYAETGGVVTIDGGTVSGGTATGGDKLGGNICLYNTSLYFKSGSITGGSAAYGGTLGLNAANLFQTGGTLTGGTATTNGGSVYGYNGAIIQISAGTVTGGKASSQGGNIMMNGGQLKISGTAQVTNGEASLDGGNIYVWGGNTTTITGGTISGGNAVTRRGGNLVVENAKVTISGGTISGGKAVDGGNIYTLAAASGSYGLVIEGNAAIQNGTATNGGNIVNKGTITATGGSITGGSASYGGSVYMGTDSAANLSGMTITGGTASGMGGTFYVAKATLTLNNCAVSGGKATSWGGTMYADTQGCVVTVKGTTTISGGQGNMGGNIAINDKAELKIESGEISGGTAPNFGGNIYMNNGTLTQTGGTVKNGTSSTDRGGNLYIASGVTANISNATYEGGSANVYGGNIFNSGTLTVTGTSITGGNAARGGNVHCATGASFTDCIIQDGTASYGGNIRVDGSAQCTFTECTIKNGTASSGGGNMDLRAACTFNTCTLEVSASGSGSQFYNEGTQTFNDCTLTNGTVMGDGNIVLNNSTVNMSNLDARVNSVVTLSGNTRVNKMTVSAATCGIHVMKDFTGEVNFASMIGAPDAPVYGKALGSKFTAEGNFTGKLIPTFTLEEPWVCNKNGSLVFAACRIVNNDQGTWYADAAEALADYDGNGYLWPAIDGTIPVNGACIVDLAGTNQTITGTGNVTLFDSANADYKTYGTATVNGPTVTNEFETVVNGNAYYMIENDGKLSFHRLGTTVNGVSLRPSAAGIYYTSNWACDDLLKTLIQNFGVAVSLVEQPDANFVSDNHTLYTQFDKSEFESGVTKTSVLITDIFLENISNNATRGKKPIYATAYVTLKNGEGLCYVVDQDAQRYSLHDVLTILEQHRDDYSAYAETLENFMTKWSAFGVTGADWEFDFAVAEEIKQLNAMYAGNNAYQGEMHDHANTGGRSDGKQTLQTWIDGMKKLKMDFATIVDHDQSRHMYLDEWDDATFIGGTETTGWLTGKATVSHGEFHMNLIFAEVEKFEAFIEEYADVFKPQRDPETGAYIFKPIPEGVTDKTSPEYKEAYTYLPEDKEYLMELAAAVRKHGGFFAHVHPKQAMQSTNVEDYWFGDWTGLEVQYTYLDGRNGAKPQANYQLWLDLLAAGKKIYATAGNDEHNMPTVKALTTIYAPENTAVSLVEQMREGNFNPGPVGIRMAIGDIPMGKEGDFTGKKLAFVIGDIHESELTDGEHNYKVVLFKGGEEVQRWDMPATGDNFYQVVEIDENADFYRLEVIDVEGDTIDRVALSQPIWNTK